MNILMTNAWLVEPGGTETWTATVAKELYRRGHNVHIRTTKSGKFLRENIPFAKQFNGQHFDIAICNHKSMFPDISADKIINISHSPFLELERLQEGCDTYFSVSEEVREIEQKRGFESEVLINPICLDDFYPKVRLPDTPKKVLFYSHYESPSKEIIESFCNELSLEFIPFNRLENRNDLLNKADVVISVGRGALEALCARRFVIGADDRGYTGLGLGGCGLTYDIQKSTHDNFTGRLDFKPLTLESFVEYLSAYDAKRIKRVSQEYRALCDVEKIVDRLML